MNPVLYYAETLGMTERNICRNATFVGVAGGPISITRWNAAALNNTPQPTAAEIATVVAMGPSRTQLVAYAENKQEALLDAGVAVNVAASGATAVNVLCQGTQKVHGSLALMALFGQTTPAGSKMWVDKNGVATVLIGTECVALATLAGTWIDNMYAALATVCSQ